MNGQALRSIVVGDAETEAVHQVQGIPRKELLEAVLASSTYSTKVAASACRQGGENGKLERSSVTRLKVAEGS